MFLNKFQQLKKKISQRLQFKAKSGIVWGWLFLLATPLAPLGLMMAFAPDVGNDLVNEAVKGAAIFVELLAKLALVVFGGLIKLIAVLIVGIAQYNNFANEVAVVEAWGILRDIGNMFFIILFLVMAVGTILKKEQYSWQKMLIPLALMAIFINFSKTICALVIDFAQVIMLTFVNGFKDVGGANFIKLLGLDQFLAWDMAMKGNDVVLTGVNQVNSGQLIMMYWLACLVAFVALVVLTIVAVILILRIIALWFLIILSPLAFIFYVVPGAQQYAKKWQDTFFKNLISGPVIAFFIWVSFLVVEKSINIVELPQDNETIKKNLENITNAVSSNKVPVIGQVGFYVGYIFGIGLLIGSLVAAKQLGTVGASLAGKGINFLQTAGTKAVKGTAKWSKDQLDSTLLKTTKGIGQRMGFKSFQGFNVASISRAYQTRKRLAEQRRLQETETAAMRMAVAFDKIVDPGYVSKKIGDWVTGVNKQNRRDAKAKEEAEEKARQAEENRDNAKKRIDELSKPFQFLQAEAEQLKKKIDDDQEMMDKVQKGWMGESEMKTNLRKLGMSDEKTNTLTPTELKNQVLLLLQQRIEQTTSEYQTKLNVAKVEEERVKSEIDEETKKVNIAESERKKYIEEANKYAQQISERRYKTYLGLNTRERPWLESLENRKRVSTVKQQIEFETNNEEQLVVEKLKEAMAQGRADTIQACLEILSQLNGFNTILVDPWIRSRLKEYVRKNNDLTNTGKSLSASAIDKIKKMLDQEPTSPAILQLFLRHTLEDICRFSNLEAARTGQRILKNTSLNGNFSFDGAALTNPVTGITEWSELAYNPETGRLDIGRQWRDYVKKKFSELESQTRNRIIHFNSLATQMIDGTIGQLHEGGKAILECLTEFDINYFDRLRTDTLRALSNPKILKAMEAYAKEIEPKNATQANIIRSAINKLKKLSEERKQT